ncbi:MAG TPA: helix-turn-helix transcriptional regulator [Methylophilus sp.]|nr:helix-turn-helix transcriptional regulator [Methylophilus sp.]HQQ34117.1 helix-turn-helix transcriptional regulator [Methylophilus sp.]
MIYIQIEQVIKQKKAAWGRKITLNEIAIATGISRTTLFRMMKNEGYSTVTDHLDKLCAFFGCEIQELVKYVPDGAQQHRRAKAA